MKFVAAIAVHFKFVAVVATSFKNVAVTARHLKFMVTIASDSVAIMGLVGISSSHNISEDF